MARTWSSTWRRAAGPGALLFAVGYAGVRLFWALGGRWGYSACRRGEVASTAEEWTGCAAADLDALSPWSGWGAVGLCGALVLGGVLVFRRTPGVSVLTGWSASAALATVAFPLHLLFQVPAGLAGRPTDWLDVLHRLALTGGAALFGLAAAAAAPRPCPHPRVDDGPREAPRWMRLTAYAGVVVPVLGWAVPHGLWALGVPFGIPAAELAAMHRDLSPVFAATITLVPALASLLTLGLVARWGQVLPGWVPVVGGRGVPRPLALVPAGLVGMALTAYGVISIGVMVTDLVAGTTSRSELAGSWAVTGTLLVFLLWGVALAATALGYHRLTRPRCDRCAPRGPRPHGRG